MLDQRRSHRRALALPAPGGGHGPLWNAIGVKLREREMDRSRRRRRRLRRRRAFGGGASVVIGVIALGHDGPLAGGSARLPVAGAGDTIATGAVLLRRG